MCGIAGIYQPNGATADPNRVAAMCDLIRHRGPDDYAVWNSGPVALGHRRLSIIDLSPRGRNPMPNEDETIWITFNGEIYNYRQLREDLLRRGHLFRSETDTEVIIHLYEEEGPAAVERLNGMFAFALWDSTKRRLLLARDRFGVKPLYYTTAGNWFAFASEVKAFLALPEFSARPDLVALSEHLTFQNTFGERTFFEGVRLLPAGHYLLRNEMGVSLHQYWDLAFDPDNSRSLDGWAAGLRERFETAVTRQLMSDVPLGSFLSGGMDTGSISAVAARNIPAMHTFTCGFDVPEDATDLEQHFDEREESHLLANLLGTVHHELTLGPDAMAPALPHVVWHLDEPRVGISYQVYYTAEMIRRYVTVVLSGVGGDELFAGYPWRYEKVLYSDPKRFDDDYYRLSIRFLDDSAKRELFTGSVIDSIGDYSSFDSFRSIMSRADRFDPLHRALYFDFKTFLNGLLIVDDKLAMAHSVEGRVPFLDNELVDYVGRIPAEFKLRPGESKIALKRAMQGLLPGETLERRKQGFTPPDQSWYRGRALGYIRELILGNRALSRDYFQRTALERILDDHVSGRANNRFLIWSLMCFEWWNRLFVDREALPEIATVAGVPGRESPS
ncbi:MAG TPA: asparagine synthase (glutamine-hydrolyzing) [Blastocatellia bacterium]|nr:asparagine synthase (glutamine-hydrolyzing) [Blastocatellia bacterium]